MESKQHVLIDLPGHLLQHLPLWNSRRLELLAVRLGVIPKTSGLHLSSYGYIESSTHFAHPPRRSCLMILVFPEAAEPTPRRIGVLPQGHIRQRIDERSMDLVKVPDQRCTSAFASRAH